MSENFTFRWGISEFDCGYTTIPNVFFDWYHKVVTYKEFALILHLARYAYEKPGSQCRPSLQTVANQMGLSRYAIMRSITAVHPLKKKRHNLISGQIGVGSGRKSE